jgi:bifunctional non-homologous end joining protein LigD
VKIRGALETLDGAWRVEVVQQGAQMFYRVSGGEQVTEKLPIASVIRILGEAGIDMADLVEVDPDTPMPGMLQAG